MKRQVRNTGPWVREDRLLTPEELAWLQSMEGRAVCEAMAGGEFADSPSAIARWRQKLDADLVSAAWVQVTLRNKARDKFSRADNMLFDRVGLEQATDETIARHKARRFEELAGVTDL
ncbi:MAG: hypothetical protein JSV03_08720 [Planctomycetota bacterium]|nr:MAG: hypothetical protein JSV03_08720 [Planctomycetota bacterium]